MNCDRKNNRPFETSVRFNLAEPCGIMVVGTSERNNLRRVFEKIKTIAGAAIRRETSDYSYRLRSVPKVCGQLSFLAFVGRRNRRLSGEFPPNSPRANRSEIGPRTFSFSSEYRTAFDTFAPVSLPGPRVVCVRESC